MRPIAIIAAVTGIILLMPGCFGIYFSLRNWTFAREVGSSIGVDPVSWSWHFLGTAISFVLVGLMSLFLSFGMWRHSVYAGKIWLALVSCLTFLSLIVFYICPLPFGFQKVTVLDLLLVTMICLGSWEGLKQ